MKRLLSLSLVVLLIAVLLNPTVPAATKPIRVIIDGQEMFFDPAPQIIGGSTLVPFRAFFEALGATVDWNDATSTAIGIKDGTRVELTIDKKVAKVNGEDKPLTAPAQIVSGRTFIPLRFVGEALGCEVHWSDDYIITITSRGPPISDEVHFIDVGQGDSILIISDGKAVLIDAGERDQGQKVVDYLSSKGVKALDLLISTHPHADHIGGLITVLEQVPVAKVIDAGVSHTSQTYLDYLNIIDAKDIAFEKPNSQKIQIGNGTLDILGPVKTYSDLNNSSVVAKYTVGKVSFLLTGDMEQDAENDLMAVKDVYATVLKVGHHGSKTSTSSAFLNSVKPAAAVICVGKGNSYDHPAPETLDKLSAAGAAIYRTDEQGNIVMSTDGNTYLVNIGAWKIAETPDPQPTGKLQTSATMSDTTPPRYSTVNAIVTATRNGQVVSGAAVEIVCNYKTTTTTYTGVTGTNGIATIPIKISGATLGFTVRVDVKVTVGSETATTTTAFTPQ